MTSDALSNTDRAVAELRELIFSGRLAPGSNHFEQDLADKLGMSRTPVREAALMLEAQGLVQIQPRRGVRINGLSVDEMADIYDVLGVLEALAAERVADKIRTGALSGTSLGLLRESTAQMRRALDRGDRDSWATADEMFHTELVRLAGNTHLEEAVTRTLDQVRRARMMTLHLRDLPVASTDDHAAVLTAIEAGDGQKARDVHAAHRRDAKDVMVDLLRRMGTHQI